MSSIFVGILAFFVSFGGLTFTDLQKYKIPMGLTWDETSPTYKIVKDDRFIVGSIEDAESPTGRYLSQIYLANGQKGYISQWIDVIFDNPVIELITLLFIAGTAIAFYKRILRT